MAMLIIISGKVTVLSTCTDRNVFRITLFSIEICAWPASNYCEATWACAPHVKQISKPHLYFFYRSLTLYVRKFKSILFIFWLIWDVASHSNTDCSWSCLDIFILSHVGKSAHIILLWKNVTVNWTKCLLFISI